MNPALSRFPAAFVAAALAPACLTGLILLVLFGPAGGIAGFGFGLVLAALHVVFLAVPIHALLCLRRTPGPIAVLASSFLIGALPLPLLVGAGEELPWGLVICGLLGVSGGIAFLLTAGPSDEDLEQA